MTTRAQWPPKTLGLFEQRIAGDDCLMKLASLRFAQAGMGAEVHAVTPQQLEWVLRFRPRPDSPVVLHLPRQFNLLDEQARQQMSSFARQFGASLYGMVLHDHETLISRADEYAQAARKMDRELGRLRPSTILFIEYAVGLEPEKFAGFFSTMADLERLSACIDIGHVSMRAASNYFATAHTRQDVRALRTQGAELARVMESVQTAVASGCQVALDLIGAIAALNKPVHYHLHDGHPLSTFSPFGVPDHLSFFTEIPLNFDYHGRYAVGTAFGPSGMAKVIARALGAGAGEPSFTLEIHPTEGRLALEDAAPLFSHWSDKTNAEQMNHWLSVLTANHTLLQRAIQEAAADSGLTRNRGGAEVGRS